MYIKKKKDKEEEKDIALVAKIKNISKRELLAYVELSDVLCK